MLRYKTKTRPGLVALYDIRPGNGAGPFLQPRSLHGASQAGQLSLAIPPCTGNISTSNSYGCCKERQWRDLLSNRPCNPIKLAIWVRYYLNWV